MKKLKKKLQMYQNLVMFGEDPSLLRIFSRSSCIQSCCQNQQLQAFYRSNQYWFRPQPICVFRSKWRTQMFRHRSVCVFPSKSFEKIMVLILLHTKVFSKQKKKDNHKRV